VPDQVVRKGPGPRQRRLRGAVTLGQHEGNDAGHANDQKDGRHHNGMAVVLPACGLHRSHIQTDENDQAFRMNRGGFLAQREIPIRPEPVLNGLHIFLRRFELAVDFKGVRPLRVGHPSPPGVRRTGYAFEIEVRSVDFTDQRGVAVGQDHPLDIRHDQVVDIRLPRRFHEELLQLEVPPSKADAGSHTRLEGTDQRRSLLDEESRRLLALPADILKRNEDEKRQQHRRCADDEPGGDAGPESFFSEGPFLFSHNPLLWILCSHLDISDN